MTYGVEVVIPLESGFSTLRTDQFNIEENNCLLLDNLDVVREKSGNGKDGILPTETQAHV